MLFLSYIVGIYLVALVFLIALIQIARKKKKYKKIILLSAFAFLLGVGLTVGYHLGEVSSLSSAAASAMIMMLTPTESLLVGTLFFALTFSASVIICKLYRNINHDPHVKDFSRRAFWGSVLLFIILCGALSFVYVQYAQYAERKSRMHEARNTTDVIEMENLYQHSIHLNDYLLLKELIKNKKVPVELLRQMYAMSKQTKNNNLLEAFAENPLTPPEILKELFFNKDKVNFTDAQMDILKNDLALNPATPVEVMKILASDPNALVRQMLTTNPNVPQDILKKLSHDESETVKANAAYRLKQTIQN